MSGVDARADDTAPETRGCLIREALPHEYAAVDLLITAAYAHDYGEPGGQAVDSFRSAEVRARTSEVQVAVGAGGELLGSATLRRPGAPPLHEDFGPETLDLRLLGVSPRSRRRGIAAALMRRALHRAAAGGFSEVALKTQPHMVGAHRLYEALGFERAPEHDGLWIGGERVLDLLAYRSRLPAGG